MILYSFLGIKKARVFAALSCVSLVTETIDIPQKSNDLKSET